MKKLISMVLASALALSLAACGNDDQSKVVINGPEDLAGKKIGVQLGTTGDIYISDEFGDENIDRYNKGFEAVQALLQGKVDAVVIDDQPAKAFVEKSKGLKILDTEYAVEDYAMAIKKENTELLDKVNTAIAELKADGTLQLIVDYYINDEEGATRYTSPEGIKYSGTLVMATNAEFEPYEFYEGGVIVGIDADFALAIADKLGMKLVIEDMAFDSIIAAVQGGKADFGLAGMTVTEDRLKQINFSDSYYTGRQVIIVKE